MKAPINSLLSFSRKEKIAIIFLVFMVLALTIVPFLFLSSTKNKIIQEDSAWKIAANKLLIDSSQNNIADDDFTDVKTSVANNNFKPTLFTFDPNQVGPEEMRELGFRDRTITIIQNYRTKGGQFRKPEDLRKIYGLRSDEYTRLAPYIAINLPQKEQREFTPYSKPSYQKPQQKAIDINTADTTAFQSLYGIGSKLAARIVNFRSKLGGFYSIEQVGETYGLPDSTFQSIKPFLKLQSKNLIKINVNTASVEQLKAHPYIGNKLAYLILKKRKETGFIGNIEDLKSVVAETTDIYEKVAPYLSI